MVSRLLTLGSLLTAVTLIDPAPVAAQQTGPPPDTTATTDDTIGTIFDVGAAEATSTDPCEIAEPCPLSGDAFAEVAGTTPTTPSLSGRSWRADLP